MMLIVHILWTLYSYCGEQLFRQINETSYCMGWTIVSENHQGFVLWWTIVFVRHRDFVLWWTIVSANHWNFVQNNYFCKSSELRTKQLFWRIIDTQHNHMHCIYDEKVVIMQVYMFKMNKLSSKKTMAPDDVTGWGMACKIYFRKSMVTQRESNYLGQF